MIRLKSQNQDHSNHNCCLYRGRRLGIQGCIFLTARILEFFNWMPLKFEKSRVCFSVAFMSEEWILDMFGKEIISRTQRIYCFWLNMFVKKKKIVHTMNILILIKHPRFNYVGIQYITNNIVLCIRLMMLFLSFFKPLLIW